MLCKVFLITESGKFLLAESGIRGFGIQNSGKGSRIPPTFGNWNPESNEKVSGIQSLESGTHKVDLSWITLHGTRQQSWPVDLANKV